MAYITREQMASRYPSNSYLFQDDLSLNAAILDAESEADGYLASRYHLPLPSVPDALMGRVCDIVRYRLWRDQASEEVRQRYRDAVSWFRDVSAGRAVLLLAADTTTGTISEPVVNAGRIVVEVVSSGGAFGDEVLNRIPGTSPWSRP